MTVSTFFVSETALRTLKQRAQRGVKDVSSSHLSEAVAAALGFKTHAALRTALAGRATTEARKPSNARLVQRLRQFGYAVSDELRLLPEFEHSYSPFKTFPLRTQRSARWRVWRNLMVAAVNAGLEQRLFGLSEGENWWPGGAEDSHYCARSTYRFMVDEDLPAVASVDAISGGELSINVVLKPRKADIRPEWYCDLSSGDAVACGWIERRLGAWIQDGGEDVHCKRALQSRIADMAIEPIGYSDQGSFFM